MLTVKTVVEYCIQIDATDVLFNEVYDYMSRGKEVLFLSALEPFVLSRQLSIVPPKIIAKLVAVSGVQNFEELVLGLDLSNYQEGLLDLEQICERHLFERASFYINHSELLWQHEYSCCKLLTQMF